MRSSDATRPAFGVSFPQSCRGGSAWLEELARFLDVADRSALHSLWVQEQLLGTDPSFEPLVSLAFASANTRRLRLGTATVVAPLRSPLVLAKQVAGLDQLSGGRMILGLSVGGDDRRMFDAAGVDLKERPARIAEAVELCRALWTGTAPSRYSEAIPMSPAPVQVPHPPIWFGGMSSVAVRRAVEAGSGWIGAGGASIEDFAKRVGDVEVELERRGRSRRDFTIAKKIYLAIDDDVARAESDLDSWFVDHWPSHLDPLSMRQRVAAAGDIERICQVVEDVVSVGADLVILNPVFREFEQLEAVCEVAGTVAVRGRDQEV